MKAEKRLVVPWDDLDVVGGAARVFASHLVMAGVDLVSVKEFLGHADVKMTLRWAHLPPDYKWAAIDRLDTSMDTRHEKRGYGRYRNPLKNLERDTGLEPATFALARRRSTN